MANTGGTGLILIGVQEDSHTDRPLAAWRHKAGDLRPQSLEQRCRLLQPYVPIEITWARKPGQGEITLARVPDFWDRPVFVPDRGVLVRQGQSNVPAALDQLRWWFTPPVVGSQRGGDYGFAGYFVSGPTSDPRLNVGVSASRPWNRTQWDDVTDERLERVVRRRYPDLRDVRIGESLVQFSVPNTSIEAASFVRCFESGAVLRRVDPSEIVTSAGAADMRVVASEMIRSLRAATESMRIVLVGYEGPLTVWLAVSGFVGGLAFPTRQGGLRRQPLTAIEYWVKTLADVPQATCPEEITEGLLPGLSRAFGYRNAADAVHDEVEAASNGLSDM